MLKAGDRLLLATQYYSITLIFNDILHGKAQKKT